MAEKRTTKDDTRDPAQVEMAEKYDDEMLMTPTDAEVKAVQKAHEKGEDDNERAWAEREAAGFAPRLRLDDTRPREVREAETRKALGMPDPNELALEGTEEAIGTGHEVMRIPSSAERAEEYNRLRAAPGYTGASGEILEVTVNGVTVRYRAGEEAKLPAPHAEVVRQSMNPYNTVQMMGRRGGAVIDLT